MSDKHLTEAGWKTFTKGKDLKDAAMLKALSALSKASPKDLDARGDAIGEVTKQAEMLLKLTKADKDAQRYLTELIDEAREAQKAYQKEQLAQAERDKRAKAEQAAAESSSSEDESEESPAQLTTQLVTHLKLLASTDGLSRPFVIGLLGPKVAVLLAKKAIGAGQKKVVQTHLGGSGVKFVQGECVFEKNAYTFVLDKSVGGLAVKLAAALLEQTGKRYKVRVRGSDPADVDEEPDELQAKADSKAGSKEATGGGGDATADKTADKTADNAADNATAKTAATATATAPQLLAALNKLTPQIKQCLSDQPGRKDELLRPMAQFQAHIKIGQLAEAQETLKGLVAALKAPATSKTPAAAESPPSAVKPDPAAAANDQTLKKTWAAAKDTWNASIETVNEQINQVRASMQASGDPDLIKIAELGLPALTANHKTPVMKALFDIDATTGDARRQAAAQARTAITAFRQHLGAYNLIRALDENAASAFGVKMTLRAEIGKGLTRLEQALQGQ